jgi:hypothetical protein
MRQTFIATAILTCLPIGALAACPTGGNLSKGIDIAWSDGMRSTIRSSDGDTIEVEEVLPEDKGGTVSRIRMYRGAFFLGSSSAKGEWSVKFSVDPAQLMPDNPGEARSFSYLMTLVPAQGKAFTERGTQIIVMSEHPDVKVGGCTYRARNILKIGQTKSRRVRQSLVYVPELRYFVEWRNEIGTASGTTVVRAKATSLSPLR